MKYYIGNNIYSFIEKVNSFHFTREHFWPLIYGDRNIEPKVIIALSAYNSSDYHSTSLTPYEERMIFYIKQLSERTSVPWIYVRFDKDATVLQNVITYDGKGNLICIDLNEYCSFLQTFGLPCSNYYEHKATKEFNTGGPSNVYQIWQMKNGNGIVSSDIDLWRTDENGIIKSVFELKRSFIELESWIPYEADYNNFILVKKLLAKASIVFYIVYNHRINNPYFDDIHKLKVFKVNWFNSTLSFEKPILFTLDDFFNYSF